MIEPPNPNDVLAEVASLLSRVGEVCAWASVESDRLAPPAPDTSGVAQELGAFYATANGLDAPNVGNGYFIDPIERFRSRGERGEPESIQGDVGVQVFGSDGGGGRFALGPSGAVVYLHSEGEIVEKVYYPSRAFPVRELATNFPLFICAIRDDIRAFVERRPEHEYLV
jgi:hypothetical protein